MTRSPGMEALPAVDGIPTAGLLRKPTHDETIVRDLVGELLLGDIGIPPVLYERFGIDARRCFIDGDLVRVLRS